MRIIRHDRNHPFVVKLGELPGLKNLTSDEKVLNYEIHPCACGLSRHKPFCDGSHMKTQDEKEGVVCVYTLDENRKELQKQSLPKEISELPNEYE